MQFHLQRSLCLKESPTQSFLKQVPNICSNWSQKSWHGKCLLPSVTGAMPCQEGLLAPWKLQATLLPPPLSLHSHSQDILLSQPSLSQCSSGLLGLVSPGHLVCRSPCPRASWLAPAPWPVLSKTFWNPQGQLTSDQGPSSCINSAWGSSSIQWSWLCGVWNEAQHITHGKTRGQPS